MKNPALFSLLSGDEYSSQGHGRVAMTMKNSLSENYNAEKKGRPMGRVLPQNLSG